MSSEDFPLLSSHNHTNYSTTVTETQMNLEHDDVDDDSVVDYTFVEYPTDDVTGVLLDKCTRFVVRPYNIFLCIIGWRKFNINVMYERTCDTVSLLWPFILFTLLLISCSIQIMLCFTRDTIPVLNSTPLYIKCSDHIVSSFIILDGLLLLTYLYGMFIFRFQQPEDLSGLTQKVFCAIEEKKSKTLAYSLLFVLVLGLVWIIYSFGVSILRICTHHLTDDDVQLEFFNSYNNQSLGTKVTLLIITQFGFVLIDIAYAAVIVNYTMQCQLIIYSLDNINTRLMNKSWTIDETIKEINSVRVCLSKINGHLSRATSAIMFIFLYSSVSSIYSLQQLKSDDNDLILAAVTGILSSLQWTIWLLIPLVQAARVTYTGYKLKETSLEIRSRPFQYKDNPQIELDSLVIYCSNVQMKAKLLSIPITPQLVLGGGFFLGFTMYMVLKFDNFSWAKWL